MWFSRGNMLFLSSILLKGFTAANPLPPASIINRTYEPRLPFNFTEIFTASLSIGNASSRIQIPGGVLLNEPVTGGTVTGPMINATIQGGFAHPPIYNGTIQVPVIDIYGVTNDGEAFYIHETGIGSNSAQVTRIEIDIGGEKYAPLRNGFILASVNPTANRTTVNVKGYLVENTLA